MFKKIFIVGDRFSKFLENENVISISKAEDDMLNGSLKALGVAYALGQGVSSERVRSLLAEVKNHPELIKAFHFREIDKAYKNLVHKDNSVNSMISKPIKLSEKRYRADVYIDDHCDDIKDHITGQHIPGMALLEACRQTFLAVTEQYYLKTCPSRHYFVINKSSVEYHGFVFPIDIAIDYVIDGYEVSARGSHKFSVSMNVIQGGNFCASVKYEFSTYEAAFLNDREAKAAIEAIAINREADLA